MYAYISMSWKGPVVVKGMLDFVEDIFVGVKSQNIGETGDIYIVKLKSTSNNLFIYLIAI